MEGRLYFEYQFNDKSPKVSMEMSPEASLDDVLEQFQGFLSAAGYRFRQDDYIDIIRADSGMVWEDDTEESPVEAAVE